MTLTKLIGWLATLGIVVVMALLLVAGPAKPESTPSPSPSPSTTPSPEPASAECIKAALANRTSAHKAWKKWAKARDCFDMKKTRYFGPKTPARSASEEVWTKVGQAWGHNRTDYLERFGRLRHAMKHPGGSSTGVRWIPLAKWVGWPSRALHTLAGLMWYESSGRERAFNSVIDCTGLTQIWPQHVVDWMHCTWSAAIRWLMVAENNLRESLRIWREQHGRFKPAWAGDPAVEAVE